MQLNLDIHGEIIVDNFAGGGGASTGIELALGRRVDVAINHDPEAVAMHTANHPETEHHCESVWEVDPRAVKPGRPIGLLWLSPDCKHFSKAKGGKPVEKKIRGLAWVALRWAALRQPRVIMLENVEEFVTWGPLVEDAAGNMRPCPKRKGREFNAFRNALQRHGYQVEWKELRACGYGAPTIRKRLFLIARRDGQPIVWPAPTHYDPNDKKYQGHKGKILNADGVVMQPWRTAAECIDWSIPAPSIFERTKPLADATCRRIAKGIMRYVVNAADPFIVNFSSKSDLELSFDKSKYGRHAIFDKSEKKSSTTIGQSSDQSIVTSSRPGCSFYTSDWHLDKANPGYGRHRFITPILTEHANASTPRCMSADEPLRTICAQTKGGHHALIAPTLVQTGYGEREGQQPRALDIGKPLGTLVGSQKHALVSAFLAKHYGGVVGTALDAPISTVTSVDHHSLVTSNLVKMRGDNIGQSNDEPLHTISAQGTHFAEVRAFLIKYYGADQDPRMEEPMHTVTSRDRFGLVTIAGHEYQIADIGLRMLAPRELYRAQGFPADYIIDYGIDAAGNRFTLTKTAQVRMCGNSVCPPLAAALVRCNLPEMIIHRRAA